MIHELTEESKIHFDRYEQLSYQNKGNIVELFVDDFNDIIEIIKDDKKRDGVLD